MILVLFIAHDHIVQYIAQLLDGMNTVMIRAVSDPVLNKQLQSELGQMEAVKKLMKDHEKRQTKIRYGLVFATVAATTGAVAYYLFRKKQ